MNGPAVVLFRLELLLSVTHSQQMSFVDVECHYLLKQLIQSLTTTTNKTTVDNRLHLQCAIHTEYFRSLLLSKIRLEDFLRFTSWGSSSNFMGSVEKMYRDLGLTPKHFKKVLICTTIKTWVTSYI